VERLQGDACALVERAGLLHRPGGRRISFPLDVVPRVLAAGEWERVEAALAQRVTALNAFVADAYGPHVGGAQGLDSHRGVFEAYAFGWGNSDSLGGL